MIKIRKVEIIDNNFYAKGKLILLEPTEEDLANIPLEGIEGSYVWFKKYYNNEEYPTMEMYKPIIISETEGYDLNDFILDGKEIHQLKNPQGLYFADDLKKVLALPEHFSKQTLQDIISGELKDGDEFYIECEQKIIDWSKGHYQEGNGTKEQYFEIKLTDNYITIKKIK